MNEMPNHAPGRVETPGAIEALHHFQHQRFRPNKPFVAQGASGVRMGILVPSDVGGLCAFSLCREQKAAAQVALASWTMGATTITFSQ